MCIPRKPDFKVEILDDDSDAVVVEKFGLVTPTGAKRIGPNGDRMPATPEREISTYPDPNIAFTSLSSVERYVFGKVMLGPISPSALRQPI